MNAARRWYSPELWLVVGIPLATVVGGMVTLALAVGDLSADGEHEGVQRTAQMQTADLDPDLAAARQGLSARLRVDRTDGQVRVWLPAAIGTNTQL